MVLPFKSVDEILKCDFLDGSFTEQYFLVELFIMLYKVVKPFETVHEILECDH